MPKNKFPVFNVILNTLSRIVIIEGKEERILRREISDDDWVGFDHKGHQFDLHVLNDDDGWDVAVYPVENGNTDCFNSVPITRHILI